MGIVEKIMDAFGSSKSSDTSEEQATVEQTLDTTANDNHISNQPQVSSEPDQRSLYQSNPKPLPSF